MVRLILRETKEMQVASLVNADKKNGRAIICDPPEAGIVKDGTSSVELRGRTELVNDVCFLLVLGDYSQLGVDKAGELGKLKIFGDAIRNREWEAPHLGKSHFYLCHRSIPIAHAPSNKLGCTISLTSDTFAPPNVFINPIKIENPVQ